MDSVERLPVSTNQRIDQHLKSQELELSLKEISHPVSSEDSTTEVTFQLQLNMDHKTKSTGKLKSNNSIIIITCQFSLRVSEKSKTHTDSWQYKVFSICLRREVLRFFQSSLNLSFPSRVINLNLNFYSRLEH